MKKILTKFLIYFIIFGIGIILGTNLKAEVIGLNDDLSGQKYPIPIVKQEGMSFTSTTSKVEDVLDKIEKAEKDTGVYYDKITTITPKNAGNQYCYTKVIIKQKGNNIVKEETMECADGRKRFDGPTYWELFAQFYYSDVSTPEYCRYYNRPNHVFKSFGKTCLKKNGEWEVK